MFYKPLFELFQIISMNKMFLIWQVVYDSASSDMPDLVEVIQFGRNGHVSLGPAETLRVAW